MVDVFSSSGSRGSDERSGKLRDDDATEPPGGNPAAQFRKQTHAARPGVTDDVTATSVQRRHKTTPPCWRYTLSGATSRVEARKSGYSYAKVLPRPRQ